MVPGVNKYWTKEAEEFHRIDNVERDILLPFVAEIINNFSPKTLLDYGCGSCFLASLIRNDTEISLYDINSDILDQYQQWNISNVVVPIRDRKKIKENYYDVVVQTSVLMCVPTIDGIRDIFRDNYIALNNGGSLVVAMTHPCFLQYPFGHYNTSFDHNNFNYLENTIEYQVCMKQFDKGPVVFTDFNWNLSTILNEIIKAGFTLTKMIEHPDLKSKYFEPNNLVSPWLFLIAKK
jgi:SAM-dependent methyltransferase